jgi:hypothetical protein
MKLHLFLLIPAIYISVSIMFRYLFILWNKIDTSTPALSKAGIIFYSALWPLTITMCCAYFVDQIALKFIDAIAEWHTKRRDRKRKDMERIADEAQRRMRQGKDGGR